MAFLLVLRAYGEELHAFRKSKKIVLTWFLCPDTCRRLQGVWVGVIIFLSIFILYSKLWFGIPISWRIFEEQWFLWGIVVLQSSDSAALHTSLFSMLALCIPGLYPKTHLVQPLHYHYGCFLSHGIIYPSYTTLVLRKGKRIGRLFFNASSFERKNGTSYTVKLCCMLPPCGLKISVFQTAESLQSVNNLSKKRSSR